MGIPESAHTSWLRRIQEPTRPGPAAAGPSPAQPDLTRVRSPGWWLQLIAFGHAAVGIAVYRDALAGIVRDKVFRAVPDRGDRATAFWFMAAAPSLWATGRLLRSSEARGDVNGQRIAGGVLAGLGLTGATAMPISGFWALAAVGLAAARTR